MSKDAIFFTSFDIKWYTEAAIYKKIFLLFHILFLVGIIFFYKYKYFFFQSAFWSPFNRHQKNQSNQEQWSLCCNSPCFRVLLCTHYVPLQCFSRYFRKSKKSEFYRPYFQTMPPMLFENWLQTWFILLISINLLLICISILNMQ